MINIPYDIIIEKIKQSTSLSQEEIDSKIKQKLDQLSGLISKEGAAHIVANENSVKLYEDFSGKLQIKNILTGMRSVEALGKVVAVYEVREFQSKERTGKVGSFIFGDETGSIRVVCWGDMTDKITQIKIGDVVKIKDGYVRENNNNKEVHMNERASITVNPPGETVGEIKTSKPSSARKSIKDLQENDNNVEIFGTVVQAFEPKFFEVCPECKKRARPENDKFRCLQHGEVNPAYSYVLNVFLDDGTDNIRAVMFGEQAESFLSKEQLMGIKEDPQKFEELKSTILGGQVKMVGRVSNNAMFNRMDFIVNSVDKNPDPEEELKRLEK